MAKVNCRPCEVCALVVDLLPSPLLSMASGFVDLSVTSALANNSRSLVELAVSRSGNIHGFVLRPLADWVTTQILDEGDRYTSWYECAEDAADLMVLSVMEAIDTSDDALYHESALESLGCTFSDRALQIAERWWKTKLTFPKSRLRFTQRGDEIYGVVEGLPGLPETAVVPILEQADDSSIRSSQTQAHRLVVQIVDAILQQHPSLYVTIHDHPPLRAFRA